MSVKQRRNVSRCYAEREWVRVDFPPEAAHGFEFAKRRTHGLKHELAWLSLDEVLVAAYLQGVIDGDQVATRRAERVTDGQGTAK